LERFIWDEFCLYEIIPSGLLKRAAATLGSSFAQLGLPSTGDLRRSKIEESINPYTLMLYMAVCELRKRVFEKHLSQKFKPSKQRSKEKSCVDSDRTLASTVPMLMPINLSGPAEN